jgi:hypothetical protein
LTAGALVIRTALIEAPALVLLLAPTARQSEELFAQKVKVLYDRLGRPVGIEHETVNTLALVNGSRIVALPGKEESIRGFADVKLLVVDEAARVSDAFYYSIRPMLSVSNGSIVSLSSPFGQRGFFWSDWFGTGEWERTKVTADQCPRITPEFLAEERKMLGPAWMAQEYGCEFRSVIDAAFAWDDIVAALDNNVPAVPFPES